MVLMFMIFIMTSLWVQNRRRLFHKLGATDEEYDKFLLTKRNSLSFSVNLSILIFVCAVLDLLLYVTGGIIIGSLFDYPVENIDYALSVLGLGQCFFLIFAIPIILLYSYTKDHKKTIIDLFVPVFGIILIVFAYIYLQNQIKHSIYFL